MYIIYELVRPIIDVKSIVLTRYSAEELLIYHITKAYPTIIMNPKEIPVLGYYCTKQLIGTNIIYEIHHYEVTHGWIRNNYTDRVITVYGMCETNVEFPYMKKSNITILKKTYSYLDVIDELKQKIIKKMSTYPKVEPTVELKVDPTVELKVDPTVELKVDPTVEPKLELKVDLKVDPTVDPTVEPKLELKVDPTVEPKLELKVEPKLELKVEPIVHCAVIECDNHPINNIVDLLKHLTLKYNL